MESTTTVQKQVPISTMPESLYPMKIVRSVIPSQQPVKIDVVPEGFQFEDPSDDVFETVHGRNSVGECGLTYHITIAEVERRTNGVERLNSSNMAANLRRSKLKNGGELMRKQMNDKGIDVTQGTRQHVFPNKIISLSEAETVHMAKELSEMVEESYPIQDIGREIANEAMDNGSVNLQQLMDIEGFQECMSALTNVMSSVVPPITGIVPKSSNNKELNLGMEELSQATHGFGVVIQPTWLRALSGIGEAMAEFLMENVEILEGNDENVEPRNATN